MFSYWGRAEPSNPETNFKIVCFSLTCETMVGRFDWLVDWIEGCAYSARNEHPRAIARFQRMLSVNGPSAHVSVRIAISYNSIGIGRIRFKFKFALFLNIGLKL